MNHPFTNQSGPGPARSGLILGAFTGFLAGITAAILDIGEASFVLRTPIDLALLALNAFGRLGLFATLLGLAVAGTWRLIQKWGNITQKSETFLFSATLSALAAPGLIYVSFRIFAGGTMSKLPALFLLKGLTSIGSILLFFATVRIAQKRLAPVMAAGSSYKHRLSFISLAVAVALAARFADSVCYPRLYTYLHAVLGLVTISGFALAFRIGLQKPPRFIAKPSGMAGFFGFVILLFVLAIGAANHHQTVRSASYNHAATLSNLMRIAPFKRRGTILRSRITDNTEKKRAKRSKQMNAASLDDWPAYPDAHIILITVDALRADKLGIYGNTERNLTPNLDKWVRDEGIWFERAYAAAPHSSYSISSLHTSRFTYDEAMQKNEIHHPTLATLLNQRGYYTAARFTQGIFFTEGDAVGHYRRSNFGFQHATHGGHRPEELTDKAIEDIDAIVHNGEPPSFLWIHYFNVHEPYKSTRFGTEPWDRYDGEIFETDREIARLIKYTQSHLERDIIWFLTADHGEEFKDHGGYYHGSSLYDEQIRVPFIVSVPKAGPGHIKTPISITAFAPTALRLVGIHPPAHMMGQDLRPAIFGGETKHIKEPVIAAVMHQHMVLDWPWKLIFDPEKDVYELYHLGSDPKERANRYDTEKQVAMRLQDELNAWLDELSRGKNEIETALKLGHMHDPRAISVLMEIVKNDGAPDDERVEATNLLGEMKETKAIPLLRELLHDDAPKVATAAALTLGMLGDSSGTDIIYDALLHEDPAITDRAGLVLSELGDPAAIPALLEALGRNDVSIREQAVRALGNLRNKDAVEPLLDALAEERLRYLVVLALGKIGDPRAYKPLLNVLNSDRFTDVRGYAVVALGWLGKTEAIPRLIEALRNEPEIKWSSESLVRLGAVGTRPLYGSDAAKGKPALISGFHRCTEMPRIVGGEFQNRTTCITQHNRAKLVFFADAPKGAVLIVRARHTGNNIIQPIPLIIKVDNLIVGSIPLTESFAESRILTDGKIWPAGKHNITLVLESNRASIELDHVLVFAN